MARAEILVDGAISDQTGGNKRASIGTTPGNHEVTVRMPGYKTSTKSGHVTENRELNLNNFQLHFSIRWA